MAKILVVDDERVLVKGITFNLKNEGYQVETGYDGEEAVELAREGNFDLIILDLMMPKIDGLQACMRIREFSNVPVIMLTAKGETIDKVAGLEMGADDYIVKPFEMKELLARVHAVLRRLGGDEAKARRLTFDGLVINLDSYELEVRGKRVDTPPKELELLYFLASSPNQVFTREQLLDHIWGYEYIGDTRTVDVHIKRLREKIKDNEYWSLSTVWGIGYKFEVKR